MFRAQFPRLYELRDLAGGASSPDAYFYSFETLLQDALARATFVGWEAKLQPLDAAAWHALKNEASPYLTRKDRRRGYRQLFDILGQADGYQHLLNIGCLSVRFIPRSNNSGERTPDLEGQLGQLMVLCEVKTINISDEEVLARREPTVRAIESTLNDAFFRKLRSVVTDASDQLKKYDATGDGRHLVYVNICFDEWVGYQNDAYLRQIDAYLKTHAVPGVEVFCSACR